MPTKLILLVACAAMAGCGQLGLNSGEERSAAGGATGAPASQDQALMRQIAEGNMAEIATGKLATEKAASPRVREFAQLMIEDHSAMLTEGSNLAREKGIAVPTAPDPKHQAAMKQLETLSGQSFDRTYMQQMVKDHEQTVDLLKKTASIASDPRLRAHAQKALPRVQQHLDLAQRMTGDLLGRAQ